MKFQGALVKEQGVMFGIAIVKPHVPNSSSEVDSMGVRGPCIWGGAHHTDGSQFKRRPYLLRAAGYRQLPCKVAGAGYSLARVHA